MLYSSIVGGGASSAKTAELLQSFVEDLVKRVCEAYLDSQAHAVALATLAVEMLPKWNTPEAGGGEGSAD